MTEPEPLWLGLFATPEALLAAVADLRQRGQPPLDASTPYPVHGLARALGLRRSPLGGMVLVMGVLGAGVALGLQYWVSALDYPIVTGGKAPSSWEAFIPVLFEVTVLFSTFTAGLGMLLLLNGLPAFGHPLLAAPAMAALTRDRFGLLLRGKGAGTALLAAGAAEVTMLVQPQPGPLFTSAMLLRPLGAILATCLVAGLATGYTVRHFTVGSAMDQQPRLDAQAPSAFFADGAGMRPPAEHTVARGHLGPELGTQAAAAALVNPLPRTPAILAQGRRAYQERCQVCHGPLGDGRGSLGPAYGAQPANFHSQRLRACADGQLYWVILKGKNAMPSQAADLDPDQPWAVVHYLRALQRAQHAQASDLAPDLASDLPSGLPPGRSANPPAAAP